MHCHCLDFLDLGSRYRPSLPVGAQVWASCVLAPVRPCLSIQLTEIQVSISISMPTRGARTDGTTLAMDVVRAESIGSKVSNISSSITPTLTDAVEGVMGIANAQRSLDYIRVITEFITQPQYAPVVPMFGMPNMLQSFETLISMQGLSTSPLSPNLIAQHSRNCRSSCTTL